MTCLIWVLIFGCERVILLSQYIGDFQPDAHVKGSFGCNFTAFTFNNSSAIFKALSLSLIMGQKYKVFSEKSLIYINDSLNHTIPCRELNEIKNFDAFVTLTENGPIQLLSNKSETTIKSIFKEFCFIEASGGVVTFEGHILFIKRFGIWDLPKGKIEKEECSDIAAVREVKEECGIQSELRILKELESTYHVYKFDNRSFLKKTYWFHMCTSHLEELIPQLEEDITECKWIPKSHIHHYLSNSYPLIQNVLIDFNQ